MYIKSTGRLICAIAWCITASKYKGNSSPPTHHELAVKLKKQELVCDFFSSLSPQNLPHWVLFREKQEKLTFLTAQVFSLQELNL